MGFRDKLKEFRKRYSIEADILFERIEAEGNAKAEAYWTKHPKRRPKKHEKK